MLRARVVGNVWATRRTDALPAGALLDVEVIDGGKRLIAFDPLGSGMGEHVLVATGSVAAAWFSGPPPPVDALIIASIDAVEAAPTALPPPADEPSRPSQP